MKTIFDKATSEELINRINTLNEQSAAQWGKMNIYQMLKHCSQWEEMLLGRIKCKRSFMGRLFGRKALKNVLKDESPLMRGAATSPEIEATESSGNIEAQKAKWIALIKGHEHFSDAYFVHPFFGKMTKEQIGYFAYKHTDHHLRQFNS